VTLLFYQLSVCLDWNMPRKVVKYTSGCVCEGISRDDWHVSQQTERENASEIWVASSSSLRALIEWELVEREVYTQAPFCFGGCGFCCWHGNWTRDPSFFILWTWTRTMTVQGCFIVSSYSRTYRFWIKQLLVSPEIQVANSHCGIVQTLTV
jgi:hypothetical protein